MLRPPVEVEVGRTPEEQDQRVCAFFDAVAELAFQGLSPPLDATPERVDAVREVNADLAQVRERLWSLDIVKEMGCRG